LRTLVCTPESLAGQLDKLLSVIRLPALELGMIGFSQPMPVFPFTAFSVRDDDLIMIERLTEEQYLRAEERPEEMAECSQLQPTLVNAYCTGQQICGGQRRSSPGLLLNLGEVVEALVVGVGGVREVSGF
jgi:hypothetical protein